MMNPNNERAKLMRMIEELSFALDDTRLFLDTHPDNQEALMYYERTMQLRNRAVKDYTNKYGPINQYYINLSDGWTWNDCPLPWNGGV
ncbi:MAG: spore coat protein CotJB [Lachnospiraceae bacterium]|nr:spore coat protein CotJB [Lachnospiraceae bacterium]MDE6252567.1 spore coat protein CotJB [Lachnospiraceae bacterium]